MLLSLHMIYISAVIYALWTLCALRVLTISLSHVLSIFHGCYFFLNPHSSYFLFYRFLNLFVLGTLIFSNFLRYNLLAIKFIYWKCVTVIFSKCISCATITIESFRTFPLPSTVHLYPLQIVFFPIPRQKQLQIWCLSHRFAVTGYSMYWGGPKVSFGFFSKVL